MMLKIDALDFAASGQQILQNVSLHVAQEEFVSIVGPSGCGKSTLLNFIAGLAPLQAGEITLAPHTLGYMFQQHGLLPWRTVRDNVALGLEIIGAEQADIRARSEQIIAEMGLAGYEDHYPAQISGGMCQRVSLARTLVTRPDLILMDEPFGALDAQTRIFIQEMFNQYWEKHKKTVLFVTHDLAEAIFLSDRILVMGTRPGRVVAEYKVDIPRPRNFDQLRTSPRFNELLSATWQDIKKHARMGTERHE